MERENGDTTTDLIDQIDNVLRELAKQCPELPPMFVRRVERGQMCIILDTKQKLVEVSGSRLTPSQLLRWTLAFLQGAMAMRTVWMENEYAKSAISV